MKRWGAWLAVSVLVLACGDDGGTADTETSSTGTASSTTEERTTGPAESSGSADASTSTGSSGDPVTTSGPGSCSGTCAPPIPAGWDGPVKAGNNAVDCNGGFADPAGAFFTDFDPGEETCTCDCQPVDAACAATVEVQWFGDGGCAGTPDYTAEIDDTACFTFEGPFPPALDDDGAATTLAMDFVTIGPVVVDGGTCEGTGTFNEGGFTDSVQLCAPTAEPSMCEGGGPCIGDGTDTCVFQEGVHACPEGYPVAITGYSGSNDERECGACDCGTPTGICGASIELLTDACGAGTTVTNDDCINTEATAVTSATYDPGEAAVECGGSGTAPISGTVEPANPVTICCIE